MANEIALTTQIALTNQKIYSLFTFRNVFQNQNNPGFDAGIWAVSVTPTNLTPDVTTKGYVGLRNVDDTNYVNVGYNDGTLRSLIRMNPGDISMFRVIPSLTICGQANSAPVDVEFTVLED